MTKPKTMPVLNPTQAKQVGVPRGYKHTPRVREDNEAMPITFTKSEVTAMPVWDSPRPGADDHQAVKSKGYAC